MINDLTVQEINELITENSEYESFFRKCYFYFFEKFNVALDKESVIQNIKSIDEHYIGSYLELEEFFKQFYIDPIVYGTGAKVGYSYIIDFIEKHTDLTRLEDEYYIIETGGYLHFFNLELGDLLKGIVS